MTLGQDKPDVPISKLLQYARSSPTDTGRMDRQLQAAYAYVLKPGEDTVDLDSALRLIDQVQHANVAVKDARIQAICYLVYAHAWRERNNRDVAKRYVLLAVQAFEKLHEPVDLGYAYVEAANYYSIEDDSGIRERIRLYRLAVPFFDTAGKKEMQASTLELLGDCISMTPSGYEALPVLKQALAIYKSIGHTDLRNLYTLLGRNYAEIGDVRNALTYGLLAVKQEEEISDHSMGLCTAYNRLGMIYYKFEDYKNADESFRKALEVALSLKDTQDIRIIACSIVNAKIQQGQFIPALGELNLVVSRYPSTSMEDDIYYGMAYIGIYSFLKYTDSARPYVKRFMRIHDSLPGNDYYHTFIDPPLIRYMLSTHQYDAAKRYAWHYRDFCIQNHEWPHVYTNYYQLYQADSATGDLKAALIDYKSYMGLKDSLLTAANGKQIAALKLDYETEKKDKDIAVLTRDQEKSRSALHQAGIVRNAIIGGLIMLMILLGVSYNRYRIKRRSNFLLQLQKQAIDQKNFELQHLNISQARLLKEKEWLLKEIHHRVKNNLQIAMSLLNTQTFYLDNAKAVEAIRQSRNRMFAMSLIHQRLYQSDNLELIHMNRYIPELIEYIEDSFARDRSIHFRVRIDPVRLDVAQAVPIGLIINEAVTNSIKYAFPHSSGGTIVILMKYLDGNKLLLEIADNGVGVKPDFDIKQTNSMGMLLIDTLNQQMEGTMTIQNRNGLVISIVFLSTSEPQAQTVGVLENFA